MLPSQLPIRLPGIGSPPLRPPAIGTARHQVVFEFSVDVFFMLDLLVNARTAYFDDDHLNAQGALYVAPFIHCRFMAAGLMSA